jgi:hypothetical protein
MAFKLADSIQETATTPASGTGLSTVLGASPNGFKTFSSFMSVGDTTWLTRRMGNDFETGVFTYTAANELTPTQIFESSNGNAAVVWTAGIKALFCDLPASKAKKIYAFEDTTEATGVGTTAAALFAGGVEIAKKLFVSGVTTLSSALSITATTASSSSSTGALVVGGGAGVGGNLNVAGNVNIEGTLTLPGGSGTSAYRETFTPTASQTTFPTTYAYTPGAIDVYRNGIRQSNGSDVIVTTGTAVVFAVACNVTETIDVVYNTQAPISSSSQTIYEDILTGSAGQTVLNTTGNYTSNSVMMFINGTKQVKGVDFSAPGGNAITLTVALIGGEKVEIVYWTLSGINANSIPSMANAYALQMLSNPFMEVSQENTNTQITHVSSGAAKYTVDQWRFAYVHAANTAVVKSQQVTPTGGGFGNSITKSMQTIATTAFTSPAAGDLTFFYQQVEGINWLKLGYGNAAAYSAMVGFWINSTATGTGTLSIRNSATNRSYLQNFTVNSSNVWEYKILLVPGDVTGTWLTDANTIGSYFGLSFGAGTTYQGTNNVWQAGNYIATSATTNFFATANNQVNITGITLIPGTDIIPSSLSPLLKRPLNEEMRICQRWLEYVGVTVMNVSAPYYNTAWYKAQKMRSPDLSITAGTAGGATMAVSNYTPLDGCRQTVSASAAADVMVKVDARFA